MITCLSEIGSSYIKTNHDSVLAYLDKAKSLAQKLNDKSIELDYMIYIADIKMYSRSPHDIADAKDIALSLLRNNNYADDRKSHIMMIAALTLAKQEKPDSASIFLNQVPTENLSAGLRVLYEKCLAELFISKGDIREYQQHYEKSEDIADSIASNSRQQVLRDVEAKYDNESLKYENLRFKSKLVISVLSGLFLLSILTIALMIVSRKSLLRKRQLQVSEETIAQLNIEPLLLELEEQRYPVDAGGLHRNSINTACLQPFADLAQVTGKASEAAIVLAVPACGDADLHLRIRDVYACCVRVHDFQLNSFACVQFFRFLCHRK